MSAHTVPGAVIAAVGHAPQSNPPRSAGPAEPPADACGTDSNVPASASAVTGANALRTKDVRDDGAAETRLADRASAPVSTEETAGDAAPNAAGDNFFVGRTGINTFHRLQRTVSNRNADRTPFKARRLGHRPHAVQRTEIRARTAPGTPAPHRRR